MDDGRAVRTAVAGGGYWGKNLIRNFAALSDLRICCDASGQVRRGILRDYSAMEVTESFERVLQDRAVDAVVIATPAKMHAELRFGHSTRESTSSLRSLWRSVSKAPKRRWWRRRTPRAECSW